MQDFENALDSLIEGNSDGNRAKNEAKSIIQKAIKDYEMVTPRIGRAIKSSMELEKAAKDLGLDLPGKYNSAKERLYDEEKRNKEAIKKLQSIKGDLNF
jgi:viroplasmin and RNaseH domain-containing protein